MKKTVVIFFSGYGHTKKQAEAVCKGAQSVQGNEASLISIDAEGNISEEQWNELQHATAIIFGSPTYMGGPAWQFKKWADASSKPWFAQAWKDKIAAGFTNSSSINGDKGQTVDYFFTLAMQHSMAWIGLGLLPSSTKSASRNDPNWLGGFAGALAQSPSDASPEEGPLPGDLETAFLLGQRVGEWSKRIQ